MGSRKLLLTLPLVAAGMLIIIFSLIQAGRRPFQPTVNSTKSNALVNNSSADNIFESRFDEQGAVSIEARPIKIEPNAPLQFEIVLNTHSVELDDDLTKQAILYDDQARSYQPINWTGSEPGGHHREGILTFSSLKVGSKYIELNIKDVGDISQRTFRWEFKN